jgi:hypothetical protein
MNKYFSMQYFPIVFFINSILLSLLKILSKFSFQSKICLLCDNWERKETPNNIYFMPDIYPVQIVMTLSSWYGYLSPFGLTNEITECIRYLLLEKTWITQYSASYKFMNINIVQLMNLSYFPGKSYWYDIILIKGDK